MKVPLHAPGVRNGETGKPWRDMMPPPGKHWQYPPSKLDKMDARGEIYWSPNGNPRRKVYLDQSAGVGVQNVWLDFRDAHNQNVRITGYPTEKNPDLLRRIIEGSSKPGDIILDCFCGSGTTLAVAHELGRCWIGVDNSVEAIQTTLERFLKGTERMGDFVNGKKGNDCSSEGERLLFESFEEEGVGKNMEEHSPILQFQMFGVVDRTRELDRRLPLGQRQPSACCVRFEFILSSSNPLARLDDRREGLLIELAHVGHRKLDRWDVSELG